MNRPIPYPTLQFLETLKLLMEDGLATGCTSLSPHYPQDVSVMMSCRLLQQ